MYIDFTSKQYFFILHALAVMITFYSNDFSSICKEVGEAYGTSEADIASACAALTAVNVTAPSKVYLTSAATFWKIYCIMHENCRERTLHINTVLA